MRKRTVGVVVVAVLAVGCGNLNDVSTALFVRYAPDGHLVVFAGDTIDVYTPDLAKREISLPTARPSDAPSDYTYLFSLSDDGSAAAVIYPNTSHTFADIFSLSNLTMTSTIWDRRHPDSTTTPPRIWRSRPQATCCS